MVSKFLIYRLLFIYVLVIFGRESYGLKKGDIGTCVGKVSSLATRKTWVTITVRCRKSPKICRARVQKIQNYVKTTIGTICCNGWQHNSDLDACKPICSTGCLHGQCTAPETCHCEPPLHLDPARRNICVSPPVCDPPCVNSVCVYNSSTTSIEQQTTGICECLNNTRRYDDSRCAFCQEGYKINPDLTCTPECDAPCVNGECVAPNQCRCVEGYRIRDAFTCEPNCDQCVNSECIGPRQCKCLPGFTAVNDTHCARCDCDHGECISPGECVCNDGYGLVDGSCEPVCDRPCVNGVCSAPGVCTCFEGHARSEDPAVCCRPECGAVCDGDGECPAVACVLR